MNKVKELREEKKMSIRDLVESSGLPRQTIHIIESGNTDTNNLYLKTAKRVALGLGKSIEEIF